MTSDTSQRDDYLHPVSLGLGAIGTLALAFGFGMMVVGISDLYFDDRDAPEARTSALSDLFLERAQPAGDLLVAFDPLVDQDGLYTLSAIVEGPNGDEQPPDRVFVILTSPSGNTASVELPELHPQTHFQLSDVELSEPGRWQAVVTIDREGLQDVSTSFAVEVEPTAEEG
jgi:hypothetical protein